MADSDADFAYAQALAYAWGRNDGGDVRVDAERFARAFRASRQAINRGETHYHPCLETAWREYSARRKVNGFIPECARW